MKNIIITKDNISAAIKECRRQRGVSQVELSALLGCKQPVVSRIERNAIAVSVKAVCKIAAALNYDLILHSKN